MAEQLIEQSGVAAEVYIRKTPELIHLAECCMACSGSVSLELLYHKKPTVVLYWISPFGYRIQKFFRRVKYITLVNLLTAKELFPADITPYSPNDPDAHRVLFPEYLTYEDKSLQIAAHVINWLAKDEQREELVAQLAELKAKVGHGGASQTAAQLILAEAARHLRAAPPKPHFTPGITVASSGRAEKTLESASPPKRAGKPRRIDRAA
jgi:lipid-A-disaccharide synthase